MLPSPLFSNPVLSDPLLSFGVEYLHRKMEVLSASSTEVTSRLVDELRRIEESSLRLQKMLPDEREQELQRLLQLRVERIAAYAELRTRAALWTTLMGKLGACVFDLFRRDGVHCQAQLQHLDDFLNDFLSTEVWARFYQEYQLPEHHRLHTPLQMAEWCVFAENYSRRQTKTAQTILALRAKRHVWKLKARRHMEQKLDEQSTEEFFPDERSVNAAESEERSRTRIQIVDLIFNYLQKEQQRDVLSYFVLRLRDTPNTEIERLLDLNRRQRGRLQEKCRYHLEVCLYRCHWRELLQVWSYSLDTLGMTTGELDTWRRRLTSSQLQIWEAFKRGSAEEQIAEAMLSSTKRVQSEWAAALMIALGIRNRNLRILPNQDE